MTSKFQILEPEYPQLFKICEISEKLFYVDHNSTVSKLRLFAEKVIELIYRLEKTEFSSSSMVERIKELSNKNYLPKGVKDLLHKIRKDGNRAVHKGDLTSKHALILLSGCYRLAIWFIETYENSFVEDSEYALPDSINKKPIETLEAEINESPLVSGNLEEKTRDLNNFPAVVESRKERSKRSAKRLDFWDILGPISLVGLILNPVGTIGGALFTLGAGLKYAPKKK